jgi:hypothetical protein
MPPRLHALVQHADDFDKARLNGPIENHMDRIRNRSFAYSGARMSEVEAPKAGPQRVTVGARRTLRLFSDTVHRREQERGIAGARFAPMPLFADPQN